MNGRLTLLRSIAPRLPDNLPDCIRNEIPRVAAGNDQLPQLGRGNLELSVGVNVHLACDLFVKVPNGAGPAIDHDGPERAHGGRLPAGAGRHYDMGQVENFPPAMP